MLHSLYIKLVLVLFFLFILIGGVFLAVALYTAPMYQQEVSQQLNHDLAKYIVNEHVLIEDGVVRQDNLSDLFQNVMIINPSLELYLLDPTGQVLAHSLSPEKVKRKRVSLEPIHSFLAGDTHGLIMGDDPVKADSVNSFTVAPIDYQNRRQGYIYAILGSEKISHITEVLQRSLIMKWSTSAIFMALVFAFVAGLLLFFFLMRKLRVLSQAMQDFKSENLQPDTHVENPDNRSLDEIDAMASTFREMAGRIHSQMNHLQEAESLRRELVANVSHDLRTPLASLNGFLETLQLKSEDLSEAEKQAYLKIACNNSQRLTALVEELFELAKLEANEIKPEREAFSLAELAFDLSHQFHLRARERNIRFDVIADETVPEVSADVGMIERVLENLIDNSFKHTPEQGEIRLHLSAREDSVDVSVSDTGCGIAREELPHVLKRFYRKSDRRADGNSDSGLGLGLAIASRIVELHGSHLKVASELQRGTVFSFSLPARQYDSPSSDVMKML
jgi:signal transduction histidine kinase